MNTPQLMRQACQLAERLGYGIRYEWLGGRTGGGCEIAGKKWLFVDLALSPLEQLEQVVETIRCDPQIQAVEVPACLRDRMLGWQAGLFASRPSGGAGNQNEGSPGQRAA